MRATISLSDVLSYSFFHHCSSALRDAPAVISDIVVDVRRSGAAL